MVVKSGLLVFLFYGEERSAFSISIHFGTAGALVSTSWIIGRKIEPWLLMNLPVRSAHDPKKLNACRKIPEQQHTQEYTFAKRLGRALS